MRDGLPLVSSSRHFYPLYTTSPSQLTSRVASQGLTPMNVEAIRARLRVSSREVSERKQVGDAESFVNEFRGPGGDHSA
ncbi:hypothetical protein AJ79_09916 [Helicocarpus griseus UAMH5409]|uniref:Uncharacterized protein n=1 Tax=Helicocarpus griseus UAMH5409 TaxID=1447875 RepID=A0A2B7WGH6_9EURO|nr:hypothetical protein AJ79_09916 [Helicocarpus griseus UAMH5409]